MNRYLYTSDYVRPVPIIDEIIDVGQIWRGIKCATNPMLIKLVDMSLDGKIYAKNIDAENSPTFIIEREDLLATYELDKWGGI